MYFYFLAALVFTFLSNSFMEQVFLLTACCLFQAVLLIILVKQIAAKAPVKFHQ